MQRPPIGIIGAAQVVCQLHTGGADGHVGLANTPGAANGVGDDDADVHAEPLAQTHAEPTGGRVWIGGEAQGSAFGDIGHVDASGGHDQALAGFDNAERATGMYALGHHAHRVRGNRLFAFGRGHLHAFSLGDDL